MKKIFHMLIAALLVLAVPFPDGWSQTRLPKSGGKVSLDFHDVDVQDVVKSISEITGKNFVLDDRARGKVTVVSPTPVTVEQAYQVFLAALQVKKLCAIDIGVVTKIVPLRLCRREPTMVVTEDERVDGFVTKIIDLKHIAAEEIRKAVDGLVSKEGSIVAYGPTKNIIITDSAANIDRIMRIIQTIDQPDRNEVVEIIPLRFSDAEDVAEKLTNIFQKEKKTTRRRRRSSDVEGGAAVSKIIPDQRTNSLIVVSTREGLGQVLDLLEQLDKTVTKVRGKERIHHRALQHAKAEDLAEILSSLLGGGTPSKSRRNRGKDKNKSGQGSRSASSSTSSFNDPLSSQSRSSSTGSSSSSSSGGSGGSGFVVGQGSLFEDEVRVVADPSTNALIITATPIDYAAIDEVISKLDVRRAQAFIETLIMEVSMNKLTDVGASGHGTSALNQFGLLGLSNLGGLTPLAILSGGQAAAKPLVDPSSPAGLVIGGGSTQEIEIGNLKLPIGGALFQAVQTKGAVNVLSAPNILTTDNEKAEILIGEEVPFLTQKGQDNNGNPLNSIDRKDVGIKLAVTPHINDGDEVQLEIEQEIGTVKSVGEVQGVSNPTTTKRQAKTTVVAQDGQTIVIGGLISDSEDKSVSKVPLLGDIPLLGYLFRKTKVNKAKRNLILFLTPHVIHEPQDLTRVSVKKNNERRRFNKTHGIPENRALFDYELDKGLNMAPRQPRVRKDKKKKKRFDYDRPTQSETREPTIESDVATRRIKPSKLKVTKAKYDSFEYQGSTDESTPAEVNSDDIGSPFSDVRPPSSSNN